MGSGSSARARKPVTWSELSAEHIRAASEAGVMPCGQCRHWDVELHGMLWCDQCQLRRFVRGAMAEGEFEAFKADPQQWCSARVEFLRNVQTAKEELTMEEGVLEFWFIAREEFMNFRDDTPLPPHQALRDDGRLLKRKVYRTAVMDGTLAGDTAAVSHRWFHVAHPDPGGEKVAMIKGILEQHPHIKFLWMDYVSLPQQRDGGLTIKEVAEVSVILDGVLPFIFLGATVFVLYDSECSGRFWPGVESWVATKTPTPTGLAPSGAELRTRVYGVASAGGTQVGNPQSCVTKMWHHRTVHAAVQRLSQDDMTASVESDKATSLRVLRSLDEQTRVHFRAVATEMARCVELLEDGDLTRAAQMARSSPNKAALLAARTEAGSTPLHVAAAAGQLDAIRLLLELAPDSGALLAARGSRQRTPLHAASLSGHVNAARSLLQLAPDRLPLLAAKDREGHTPLHLAAEAGHVDVVRALVGLSPDAAASLVGRNAVGATPLHLAALGGHADTINELMDIWDQSEDFVDSLILGTTSDGSTPLHEAAWGGHLEAVKAILEHVPDQQSSISKKDAFGNHPLHKAAHRGSVEALEELLYATSDTNAALAARGNLGWAPLHFASHGGHVDAVKLLVGRAHDREATLASQSDEGATPLHAAACSGHVDVVKALVEHAERERMAAASLASKDGLGRTPLHRAALNGHAGAARALVESSQSSAASLVVQDSAGATPLHLAALDGRLDAIRALVDLAPDAAAVLGARSCSGWTPLHVAAKWGHVGAVQLLAALAPGEVSAKTSSGNTPLYLAYQGGHWEALKALQRLGTV